jgi:superoxide dismutase
MAAPQRFELPPLPYGMDALEPHTSGRTLSIHHGAHHAAYVANLNKALEQGDATQRYAGKGLDEVVKESYKAEDGSGPVFNNAGQARCDASEGVARVAARLGASDTTTLRAACIATDASR